MLIESFLGPDFAEDEEALAAIAGSLKPPKILVVDDEAETVEEIVEGLSDEGMEVTGATAASAAIDVLKRDPYFMVVVTDLRMPLLDGLELIRILEQTKKRARLVIQAIVLTGHATEEQVISANRAGAFGVLRKPCSLDDLLIEVEAACRVARQTARRLQHDDRW